MNTMEKYQRGCLHLYELEGCQCGSVHGEALQNIEVHGAEFEFQNGKTCSTCRERRYENESWNRLSGRRLVCSDTGNWIILDKCRDASERARNVTKDRQSITIQSAWHTGVSTGFNTQKSYIDVIFKKHRNDHMRGIGPEEVEVAKLEVTQQAAPLRRRQMGKFKFKVLQIAKVLETF